MGILLSIIVICALLAVVIENTAEMSREDFMYTYPNKAKVRK